MSRMPQLDKNPRRRWPDPCTARSPSEASFLCGSTNDWSSPRAQQALINDLLGRPAAAAPSPSQQAPRPMQPPPHPRPSTLIAAASSRGAAAARDRSAVRLDLDETADALAWPGLSPGGKAGRSASRHSSAAATSNAAASGTASNAAASNCAQSLSSVSLRPPPLPPAVVAKLLTRALWLWRELSACMRTVLWLRLHSYVHIGAQPWTSHTNCSAPVTSACSLL